MLKKTLENYRCPVSRCSGWVIFVSGLEERAFWGCGECGSIWYNHSKLFEEIGNVVKQFPYRQSCYVFGEDNILPNQLAEECEDYEELVAREPDENITSFIRG